MKHPTNLFFMNNNWHFSFDTVVLTWIDFAALAFWGKRWVFALQYSGKAYHHVKLSFSERIIARSPNVLATCKILFSRGRRWWTKWCYERCISLSISPIFLWVKITYFHVWSSPWWADIYLTLSSDPYSWIGNEIFAQLHFNFMCTSSSIPG